MGILRRTTSQQTAEERADRIYAVLEREGVVDDEHGVVRRPLAQHLSGEKPLTELIVDNPLSAMWRLKPAEGGGRRLAYYGQNPEREEKARRISAELAQI